jgi:hypothetical protein
MVFKINVALMYYFVMNASVENVSSRTVVLFCNVS